MDEQGGGRGASGSRDPEGSFIGKGQNKASESETFFFVSFLTHELTV